MHRRLEHLGSAHLFHHSFGPGAVLLLAADGSLMAGFGSGVANHLRAAIAIVNVGANLDHA